MEEDPVSQLRARLAKHPAERYPIQHATTLFHLGTALLDRDETAEAVESFRRAAALFGSLPLEEAKAQTMLGAALRHAGRLAAAAGVFAQAADTFHRLGAVVEEAAARHDLGLVRSQLGEPSSAHFAAALEGFRSVGATRPAAAAARELGRALLVEGRVGEAREVLETAVPSAVAAGDETGGGAAANVLGLAHLADGDHTAAVEAFTTARALNPRSLRPGQHAMAAANLALAFERAGRAPEARLAARQALAVAAADGQVRAQSAGVLERLGDDGGDLIAVLSSTPRARWSVVLREELERWADDTEEERRRSSAEVVEVLAGPGAQDEVAEALLGVALEMPPERMQAVLEALSSAVAALGAEAEERARACLDRAAARFHLPQMMRLGEMLRGPVPPATSA